MEAFKIHENNSSTTHKNGNHRMTKIFEKIVGDCKFMIPIQTSNSICNSMLITRVFEYHYAATTVKLHSNTIIQKKRKRKPNYHNRRLV